MTMVQENEGAGDSQQRKFTFGSLYSRYAFASFDKQVHLRELFGQERTWAFDMNPGTIRFEGLPPYRVQILGTESDQSKTWLWAWANTESQIPEQLLDASHLMRRFGEEQQIKALTAAELLITEVVNGFNFSMVASGLYNADAFYRAPYEGGALYLLVKDAGFERSMENPVMRISRIIPAALKKLTIENHRLAVASYLQWYNFSLEPPQNGAVVGHSTIGESVTVKFDNKGNYKNISTEIG